MADQVDDLAKAASLTAHVTKMHKAHDDHHMSMAQHHEAMAKLHKGCVDHHMKMAKAHAARHDEASGHFGQLKKMLGSEEVMGSNEPKPVDPKAGATPNLLTQAETLSEGDVTKIVETVTTSTMEKSIEKITEQVMKAVLVAMLGPEKVQEALKVAGANVDAAKGIGDRTNLAPTKIKTVVVTKDQDLEEDKPIPEPIDARKALGGDVAAQLALMKGVKPVEVPATLVDAIGTRVKT